MRRSRSAFRTIFWFLLAIFVVLYPMLISIYVFLPLMVGISGLMIIRGIEGRGFMYIVIPVIYLINLEINLSLPMLLSIFSILLYYLTLYNRVLYLKKCKMCVAAVSAAAIDIFYLLSLIGYDLMMDTHSIVIDKLLWFSMLTDVVLAVL